MILQGTISMIGEVPPGLAAGKLFRLEEETGIRVNVNACAEEHSFDLTGVVERLMDRSGDPQKGEDKLPCRAFNLLTARKYPIPKDIN